ncbi:unnamed protein product [Miscanthus lutarioriparius]|uniref:Uncharacterized protein n=1 Tax=Miscanthus lutarioriparius TaxID=422564 RepID=A0A811S668_9POAL|nr:unnamed protein product [Miscanthus lutarioriparius]
MSYIFLCPSAMSRRSATNSMYWLMSQPFIPTSATGSASQTNSRSMSTASLTISRTRDLSSLPRRPPAGSQQMEPGPALGLPRSAMRPQVAPGHLPVAAVGGPALGDSHGGGGPSHRRRRLRGAGRLGLEP